jgi:hypothetical protein
MKELLAWLKGAAVSGLVTIFQLLVLCFALLGLQRSAVFVAEVAAENCAAITEHVSLCLVDDRASVKDTATTL